MKIVQLNIWQGRLIGKIIELLDAENPDFVCLQEVTKSEIDDSGFLGTNNLQVLTAQLGFAYHYFSPRFTYDLMHTEAAYGNCILSRRPIEQQKVVFTHGGLARDIVLREGNHDMANLQLVVLDINGRKLNLLNHHGYHLLDPNGNEMSLQALTKAADLIKQLSGPVILTGDLNVWPASPALAPLNQILRNLTAENNVKSTLTNFSRADVACDYIFVNKDVHVKEFRVSQELVSDHRALILEFDI